MHGDPKYEVKNADPTSGQIIANMNFTDLASAVGLTAASGAAAFIGVKGMRGTTAATGALLGGVAGLLVAYQNSYGRLSGQRK